VVNRTTVDAIDAHLGMPRGLPVGDVLGVMARHADFRRWLTFEGADGLRTAAFLNVAGAVAVARFTGDVGLLFGRADFQVGASRILGPGILVTGEADRVVDGRRTRRERGQAQESCDQPGRPASALRHPHILRKSRRPEHGKVDQPSAGFPRRAEVEYPLRDTATVSQGG
jgi:hypothetical protein